MNDSRAGKLVVKDVQLLTYLILPICSTYTSSLIIPYLSLDHYPIQRPTRPKKLLDYHHKQPEPLYLPTPILSSLVLALPASTPDPIACVPTPAPCLATLALSPGSGRSSSLGSITVAFRPGITHESASCLSPNKKDDIMDFE